jgi:Fe-Mn family superoxide dismutase
MSVTIPELPYKKGDLSPHISAKTLEIHHGKHHSTYVTNLNRLVEGTALAGEPLDDLIKRTAGSTEQIGVFNNAAQVWNHSFYWRSMRPEGGGAPTGRVARKIRSDFGGYDSFVEAFKEAALTQFGSGWAWLVMKDGSLEVMKTANADTPIAHGLRPLLTVDVWEHAYYLDYQNRRAEYLDAFVENLIDWEFVHANLEGPL